MRLVGLLAGELGAQRLDGVLAGAGDFSELLGALFSRLGTVSRPGELARQLGAGDGCSRST